MVESDENKEEDEEVQRALAASMESMKESTVMTGRDNIDTDVAVYGQQTTLAKRPIYTFFTLFNKMLDMILYLRVLIMQHYFEMVIVVDVYVILGLWQSDSILIVKFTMHTLLALV